MSNWEPLEKKQANNFMLLRLVVALLVIYGHSYAPTLTPPFSFEAAILGERVHMSHVFASITNGLLDIGVPEIFIQLQILFLNR